MRDVYVNPKQQQYLRAKQKDKTVVAGRGFGKTHLMGIDFWQMFNFMRRTKIILGGLTYNQLYNICLPPMEAAWEKIGLFEYDDKTKFGHYVVGKQAPSHFYKPYEKPRKPEYCVSFINGFTIVLGSLDRPDTLRGGNYDGLRVDEAALVNKEDINKILAKMVRANAYKEVSKHYLHHSYGYYTSMPWTVQGQWVFENEEKAKEQPDEYFFLEGKTKDNIQVLGKDYLKKQKEISTDLEFAIECENMRLDKVPNSFYPKFSEDKHCVWRTYSYDATDSGLFVGNTFYQPDKPLLLSFDFNSGFNSMIICQEHGDEFRIINELYVTDNYIIDDLIDLFAKEYAGHSKREVNIYGDRNGNSKVANSTLTYYQQMIQRLERNNWKCRKMVTGLDPDHKLKYKFINTLFAESAVDRLPKIRINKNKCKYFIYSIQNAPATLDFKKDKSSERKLIDQRYATHLSDCLDNIICRKYAHLINKLGLSSSTKAIF